MPAAAEDTSEVPAVDVTSQHSVHDENGYYVYNGTENDTYNSLTKDGLWVGGVDDNTGFHVDNTGHASANGLDVQNQKITGVADGEFKSGSTEAVTAGQLYDAGIVPGKAADGSVAIGNGSTVTSGAWDWDTNTPLPANGVAIGDNAKVNGSLVNGVAIGQGAEVRTDNATAIGQGSRVVSGDGSVALGQGSMVTAADAKGTDAHGVVSVGLTGNKVTEGFTRRIINVADGINDSDAATVGQISKITGMDSEKGNVVQYDGEDKSVVTFAGANGTKLTNLAAGEFKADSTDAVTAGQLYAAGIVPGTISSDKYTTNGAIALGENALVSGERNGVDGSIAIGDEATVDNTTMAVALGSGSTVSAAHSIALGANSTATASFSTAVGPASTASGDSSTAVGYESTASGMNSAAFGYGSEASGMRSTALGHNSSASGMNSVALGYNSTADEANVVSVGNDKIQRKVINVADGTIAANSHDAVTGGQLYNVQSSVTALDNLAVKYDTADKTSVTFNPDNEAGSVLNNVNDIVMQVETYNTSGKVSGYKTLSFKDAGIIPGTVSGEDNTDSVVIGRDSRSSKKHSVVVGDGARTLGMNATAIGTGASAEMDSSVAIGSGSQVGTPSAVNGTAVGAGSKVTAKNGTAVGQGAYAWGTDSTVLGASARVERNADGSVALGKDSYAKASDILDSDTNGVVSVGKSGNNGFTRRIINVADGVNDSDAATVGQISKITGLDSEKGNVVQYDGEDKSVVTFAGANGTKLTNVADGEFKAGSKDAVTAGQLYAAGIVPGSTFDHNGSMAIGLSSNVIGDSGTAIGVNAGAGENAVAIGNGAGAMHLNATAVGENSKAMEEGATALGEHAWAEVTNATAIGFNSDVAFGGDNSVALGANTQVVRQDILGTDTHGVVSVGYSGKGYGDDEAFNRRIINVADGINDSDAATFGQVKDVQDSIDALDALAVQYDGVSKSTVTFDGTNGTALKNVSDIVMNTKDFYGKNAQFSFQDAGILPGDVQSFGNKWNMAIGEGSAVKVEEGTGSKMQMNTVVGNKARITQALVDGEYQDVEKSTALGQGVTVAASNAVGVGQGSNVRGEGGVAVGMQANVSAKSGVAVGKQSEVSSDYSIAIGGSASVGSKSENSVAMGYNASSLAAGGTAIGQGAKVQGGAANGTAIGKGAIVNVNSGNSVALGASSQVQIADIGNDTEYGVVSVGKSGTNGFMRRIVNVADGINDSDAATYGQVKAVDEKVSTFASGGIIAGELGDGKGVNEDDVTNGIALGDGAYVKNKGGLAIGVDAMAGSNSAQTAINATAIGNQSKASSDYSVAVGYKSTASGKKSVAIGNSSIASGEDSTAIGYGSKIENYKVNATAVGSSSQVMGDNGTAVGKGSIVGLNSEYSTALGRGSYVYSGSDYSEALGANSIVRLKAEHAVALGSNSIASESNTVSVGVSAADAATTGNPELKRRIVNVADGSGEHDAVTVGQMNELAFGARTGSLTLKNGATNLADGINKNTAAINSIDTQLDAVSDVWETNSQSLNDLTEKASAFAAQTQNVDWNALNSVDWNAVSAMAAVPATMNLAVDDGQANESGTGAEKDDDDRSPQSNGSNPGEVDGNLHVSGNTTLDGTLNVKGDATFEGNATFDKGATMKGDLNMSGNKITGLGAGDVSADSTDAVNGSQLFDVQQQVSDNRNAIGALGSRVSDLGEEVDSVGAISAALAGLHPLDYNGTGSKFQISAALGTYDGTQAAAIGGFYHFNRDTLLSIGGSTSFEGDRKTAANIGLTFRVGEGASEAPAVQDNETKQQMDAMKQEIEMLKAELEQLKNKDTEANDKN